MHPPEIPPPVATSFSRMRRLLRRFETIRSAEAVEGGVRYKAAWDVRILTEEDDLDGGWIAWSDDLPGCVSQGDTEAEALDHLGEAAGLAFSVSLADTPAVEHRDDGDVNERTIRIA